AQIRSDTETLRHLDRPALPDVLIETHGNGIHRLRQCAPKRDLACIFVVVVLRRPAADGDRPIERNTVRRHAMLQRREIDEGLEGGARLAFGLHGTIELTFGIVATADESTDTPVAVENHEGGLA